MVIIISKHLLLLLNIYIKVMSTRTGSGKNLGMDMARYIY
jgi:hypothetical protein